MRRIISAMLCLLLLLTLTACGDKQNNIAQSTAPTESTASRQSITDTHSAPTPTAAEAAKDTSVSTEATQAAVADLLEKEFGLPQAAVADLLEEGFKPANPALLTDYSIEELIEGLEKGERSAYSYSREIEANTEEDEASPELTEVTAVPFSDEPWENKSFETIDFTEGMTAEEKTQWQEYENADWNEMLTETEDMLNELMATIGVNEEGTEDEGGEEADNDSYGSSGEEDSMPELAMDGGWPDNEFTKGLPAPEFDIMMTSTDEYSFTASFAGAAKQQIAAYAEVLKGAGFTIDADITDQVLYGITLYVYSAYNAAGYHAQLTFSSSGSILCISK